MADVRKRIVFTGCVQGREPMINKLLVGLNHR